MTDRQRKALKLMRDNKVGALYTEIGWVWIDHIRVSEDAAEAVLAKFKAAGAGEAQ